MVSVFVSEKVFLVFCLGTCICFWFLFGVCLQLLSGCMAMCSPMYGLSVDVIGKVVGLVVASCCVGILSRL